YIEGPQVWGSVGREWNDPYKRSGIVAATETWTRRGGLCDSGSSGWSCVTADDLGADWSPGAETSLCSMWNGGLPANSVKNHAEPPLPKLTGRQSYMTEVWLLQLLKKQRTLLQGAYSPSLGVLGSKEVKKQNPLLLYQVLILDEFFEKFLPYEWTKVPQFLAGTCREVQLLEADGFYFDVHIYSFSLENNKGERERLYLDLH
ncbi:hypothetical protein J0S82_016437, partial [Galemys pyrenaicus]